MFALIEMFYATINNNKIFIYIRKYVVKNGMYVQLEWGKQMALQSNISKELIDFLKLTAFLKAGRKIMKDLFLNQTSKKFCV